jgi:hypothetical protein
MEIFAHHSVEHTTQLHPIIIGVAALFILVVAVVTVVRGRHEG